MKNNIFFTIVFLVTTFAQTAYGYNWPMSNFTQKLLLVQVELLGNSKPYFALVKPNEVTTFNWSAPNAMSGFCLEKIRYLVPDERLLSQTDIIDKNNMSIKNNAKLLNYLNKMNYTRTVAELQILPENQYQEIAKHSNSLGNKIRGVIANAKLRCSSRDIFITEDANGNNIGFYTPNN